MEGKSGIKQNQAEVGNFFLLPDIIFAPRLFDRTCDQWGNDKGQPRFYHVIKLSQVI